MTTTNVRELAEKLVLDHYTPPLCLDQRKIQHPLLSRQDRPLPGAPDRGARFNLLKMAREDLRYKLSTALHRAVKQKKTIISKGVSVKYNGELQTFNLVIRPVQEEAGGQGLMLVVFEDKNPVHKAVTKDKKGPPAEEADPRLTALEQELQSTKEYLQTTIEELETSKEELQSTNEELETVNAELRNKVDELSEANNDLNNLLAATEIGTIFLDTHLCVKRFTPTATKAFNLRQSDIGRPISDITANITYEALYEDAEEVLNTLNRKETEVEGLDGDCYAMRLLPYRTTENVIDGIVITFFDLTKFKQTREALKDAEKRCRSLQKEIKKGAGVRGQNKDEIHIELSFRQSLSRNPANG